MSLSKKFENLKFPKSVAGYTVKEVDAFVADVIPMVKDLENELDSLRSIASEYAARKEEITALKKEACELLEAAKAQAEKTIAEAKATAAKITDEARISAEANIRVSEITARDNLEKAEKQAAERIEDANANAKRILALADSKGREMLAEAKAKYDEQLARTEMLANEYRNFEEKFKDVVSDTVKSLAAIRDASPAVMSAKAPETVTVTAPSPEPIEAEPETADVPTAEETAEQSVEESSAPVEEEVTDFSFAGGKLISNGNSTGAKSTRRLFDAVQVTYDSEDDDFDDVKSIMRDANAKTRKSPTHFSE